MRAIVIIGSLLIASTAFADVIRMPRECREAGWVSRRVGHGGWCFPRSCESDNDCVGGGSCQAVDRCYLERTYSSGRRRFDPDQPRPTRAQPQDRCVDGACTQGECRRAQKECVYPEGTSLVPARTPEDPPPGTTPTAEATQPDPAEVARELEAAQAAAMQAETESAMAAESGSESASGSASASASESGSSGQESESSCSAAASPDGALLLLLLLALRRRPLQRV